jgi:membrane protein
VTCSGLRRAFAATCRGLLENRTLQMAAALSYYLVLSIFPALILFFAAIASLPFPDLYTRLFTLVFSLIPSQTVPMVESVLLDVLGTHHRAWLSLGTIGTIWAASTAFVAMIEALDLAYEVKDSRPFWKTRLLAFGLAVTTGCLLLCGLTIMILGPQFGTWLAARIVLPPHFAVFWLVFHWAAAISVALIAVELTYFLAPNVKQRFLATLPGAVLAVVCWIGFSYLLGFYFRHFANFSRTYGTLGGFIAFMTWFYWNSFALLVGAELNAELAKESTKGSLQQKEISIADTLDRAA